MKIKDFEAVPVLTKAFCDECNVEVKMQQNVLMVHPAKYMYKCPQCGIEYTSTEHYPKLNFKEVE